MAISGLLMLGLIDGLAKVAESGTPDGLRRVGLLALGATALFLVLSVIATTRNRPDRHSL